MRGTSERRPALDGVRGLAFAGVLLFHCGVGWLPGGFLGVDAFFVLSGYLITTGLLGAGRRVDLRAFWRRRAARLLPALLLVTAAIAVLAPSFDAAAPATRADGAGALAYVSNWRLIASGGSYFARFGAPSPFQHTWSLAVEAQFYLLWPALVALAVAKRGTRRLLMVVAALLVTVSALTMAAKYDGGAGLSRVYYGTDTRLQAPLVGALLALWLYRREVSARWAARAGVAGAAVTAYAWITVRGDTAGLYGGGMLLCAVAVAAVIAACEVVPSWGLARALAARPLARLGDVSYSGYLWHWPVVLLLTHARTGMSGPALLLVRVAVTLVLATATWRAVERPGAVRLRTSPRTVRRLGAATASVALVLAGTTAYGRLPAPRPPVASENLADAVPVARPPKPPSAVRHRPLDSPAPSVPPSPSASPSWSWHGSVAFLGDSVSLTLAQGLAGPAAGYGVRVRADGILGCGIARGGPFRYVGAVYQEPADCPSWPSAWRATLARQRPDVVAVLVGRWEVIDRRHGGVWTHVGEPAYDAYLAHELDVAIHAAGSSGARVALLTAPYYHRGERADGGDWPEDAAARVDRFNALVREAAGRHPGVTVVDLGAHLTPGGAYVERVDGVRMRYDGVHVTVAGAKALAPWLLPALAALATSG